MRAIRTRFIKASTARGARVKAEADEVKGVTLRWDHELSEEENHEAAFTALRRAHDWYGPEYRLCGSGEFKGARYWVFHQ